MVRGLRWRASFPVFPGMKMAGVAPDLVTYNTVLKACAYRKPGADIGLASVVADEMLATGMQIKPGTLVALLNCCHFATPPQV